MKNLLALTAVFTLISSCFYPLSTAHAQGTAFTYQGRLNNASGPVTGVYDLKVAVMDAASAGNLLGTALTNSATPVTNGLFTVTLDFGAGVFTGANRWLEISVRTNGNGVFTTLVPRQALTATPYSVYTGNAAWAATAGSASSVPASGIGSGTANINISGNAATATTAASASTASSALSATTALTAGTATNLLGMLPDAQLSTNIARLNGTNLLHLGQPHAAGRAREARISNTNSASLVAISQSGSY